MKQIYVDFNSITEQGTIILSSQPVLQSIAAFTEQLRDGEEVLLTDDELKVVARVYARPDGLWEARSDWLFEAL